MTCGNHHPERSGVVCDAKANNHPLCSGFDPQESDYVDWANPGYVEVKKTSATKQETRHKLADIASRVRAEKPVEGFAAGMQASEQAADKWTPEQKQTVWTAIRTVAKTRYEFTADEIWQELDNAVPVTKGLAALLNRAVAKGILMNTRQKVVSSRKGEHGHAQTLSVWRSLIYGE